MAQLKSTNVLGNLAVTGKITGELNANDIISGTLAAERLPSSGVTANTYGSSSNASPGYGGTFTIPYFTVDGYGRITAASTRTITLPASDQSDTKVTQTVTSSNANYPLLLAPNGQTATTTTSAYFDSGVYLNPSTNTINANVSGNSATATKLQTARTISLTGSVTGSGSFDGSGDLTISTTTNHTHSYAGSTSAGGSANSAVKLDSSAGSTTQPIYFKDGKPASTTYALNATVPSGAKFTDTTYTIATGDSNGQIKVTPSTGSAYNVSIKGLGSNAYSSTAYLPLAGGTMTGKVTFNMSNPHICMKDTAYSTNWYFQAYQDQLAFGPTFDSAVKTDKNGNMTVPGTVTVKNKVKLDYNTSTDCLSFIFV